MPDRVYLSAALLPALRDLAEAACKVPVNIAYKRTQKLQRSGY